MSYNEFGKQCQNCQKRRESHRYFKATRAIKGKHPNMMKHRRLCKECWNKQHIKDTEFLRHAHF